MQGTLQQENAVAFFGFAILAGADFLIMLIGDARAPCMCMWRAGLSLAGGRRPLTCLPVAHNWALAPVPSAVYRVRHVEGEDGFVSLRRWARWQASSHQRMLCRLCGAKTNAAPVASCRVPQGAEVEEPSKPSAPRCPRRPVEWTFLVSAIVAVAGTVIGAWHPSSARMLLCRLRRCTLPCLFDQLPPGVPLAPPAPLPVCPVHAALGGTASVQASCYDDPVFTTKVRGSARCGKWRPANACWEQPAHAMGQVQVGLCSPACSGAQSL